MAGLAQEPFSRKAMLENITYNIILPTHQAFLETTEPLERAVQILVQSPDAVSLSSAQAAWRESIIAWQQSNLFAIGGLDLMILHNQIAKSINIGQIEKLIKEGEKINEIYVENAGSSAKGLLALEYLLFNEEGDEAVLEVLASDAHAAYALALAENIQSKANSLYDFWTADDNAYIKRFIAADEKTSQIQRTVNKLANEMMSYSETLTSMKLAAPLGLNETATPNFEDVEGIRSESAIAQIESNLQILFKTFTGEQGLGFDDYLIDVGEAQLVTDMLNSLEEALDALSMLNNSLPDVIAENPEALEKTYEASKNFLIMTSVDMANQLGITVTFSDNDGD